MNWTDSASLTPIDGRSFSAHVGEEWSSLKGVHGGVVAALVVEAASTVLCNEGVDGSTRLRAATFAYVSGNEVGASTIDVDVIRRGRSMVSTEARVRRDGEITTVARMHHSTPRDGLEFSDLEPLPAKPAKAVRFSAPPVSHLANVETHFHPDTTLHAGADRAEWLAWCRPLGTDRFDPTWLTMLGDYFPPAVFVRTEAPSLAVTVEYAIQFHTDDDAWTLGEDEYVATQMHTFHSHAGFAVEDGRLQLPDGTLLATVRQTRLAG